MTSTRILVVEDNPKNMKLVRDVLEFSGYEVIEATSGEDGVRLAGMQRPHLILSRGGDARDPRQVRRHRGREQRRRGDRSP